MRISVLVPALVASILVAGCGTSSGDGATRTPTAQTTTASASSSASVTATPARVDRVPVPDVNPSDTPFKDGWSSYGGVPYTGCGGAYYSAVHSAEAVQVFRPESGEFWHPTKPSVQPGEVENKTHCTLAGVPTDPDLVWVQQVTVPAQGLSPERKTVRVSVQKVGTDTVARTATVAVDGWTGSPAATRSTILLTYGSKLVGVDLATLKQGWTGPSEYRSIGPNGLVAKVDKSNTNRVWTLFSPTGQQVASSPDQSADGKGPVGWSDGVTGDVFTTPDGFFDVKAGVYRPFDKRLISDGATVSAVVGRQIFLNGPAIAVVDVDSGRTVFSMTAAEVSAARIYESWYFDGHLYLINRNDGSGAYSVTTIADRKEIATSWLRRPAATQLGWTWVSESKGTSMCETVGSTSGKGCAAVLVRNVDGRYPGPWY
ncbi:hypothetical protein [Tsukamurella sp. NPDC003166]|uniref:hypothetical protein n=1 Tax=Tsukamurella sp. NPDC003166 TaxID=3154444 RepID=UPI0033B1AE29